MNLKDLKFHILEIKPGDCLVVRTYRDQHENEHCELLGIRETSALKAALKIAARSDEGNGKTIIIEEFPVDFLMAKFCKET